MFVTSDEEDREEDGAIDYKYGLAHNHRLLGAITEVCKYGLRYTRDPFSELECIYIQIYAAIFPTQGLSTSNRMRQLPVPGIYYPSISLLCDATMFRHRLPCELRL